MNSRIARIASELNYPFRTPPPSGDVLEVAPGILWIRMPMPRALGYINLWALADGDGWAIVDTGVNTPETAAAWCHLLSGALSCRPVTRVFVTHMHPDHAGMAGWLTRKFNCHLWMTRLEYLSCHMLAADTGREAPEDGIRFYRRAGWNEGALEDYRARFGDFGRHMYTLPDSFQRLWDGYHFAIDAREWRVITGTGHSPEHACLYCPELNVLISGDQVLPRISSNVSVHPTEPNADPISEWLASLDKFAEEVPEDVLVLPAHNEPFYNLHRRLTDLKETQERALDRLREALREPRRVIDLFGILFARDIRSDPMLLYLATGETIACLNHLVSRGESVQQADRGDIAWYCSSH